MRFESVIKFLLRFLLKPLSFIPALMMMYIIFSFSAQDGTASSNLSYKVTYKAVSAADRALDLELTDKQISRCIRKIHYYVRKLAHFTEYFLLAVSVSFPLYVYGIRGIWLVITGGILCVDLRPSMRFTSFCARAGRLRARCRHRQLWFPHRNPVCTTIWLY